MKQAEKIFMISDAAKQVEVEAHVLRYWEEELKLPVKRNEMGHRYYTKEDIAQFQRIKELKEEGLQLKAIRNMLKGGGLKEPMTMFKGGVVTVSEGEEAEGYREEESAPDLSRRHVIMVKKGELLQSGTTALQEETREQKSLRLQQLLRDMIVEAVQTNNQEICQEIKESLLKELDYQFRLQEEKEDSREEQRVNRQEEHYRQIDELIRSYNHKGKRKGAAAKKEKKQETEASGEEAAKQKTRKKKQDKEETGNLKNLENAGYTGTGEEAGKARKERGFWRKKAEKESMKAAEEEWDQTGLEESVHTEIEFLDQKAEEEKGKTARKGFLKRKRSIV